ncbi:NRDE protein-domain-containing protein [Cytidiella melzeri]|nr:NRDE protein-domain-containing protein [Cytidiella melzeri]
MCVGFWSLEHADYALILCSNRDEFLARPTSSAHWHSFENLASSAAAATNSERILSGRDLLAGGTWLGINRRGNVAFLTNITEDVQPPSNSTTRGELTSSFLLSDVQSHNLQSYLDTVTARNNKYAGFNLLLLAPSVSSPAAQTWAYNASYLTNHGGGGALASRPLTDAERRCGALSNGVDGLGAESWPKVQQGSRLFLDILQTTSSSSSSRDAQDRSRAESDLVERLFNLLTCVWRTDPPPRTRTDLRNTIQIIPSPISTPQTRPSSSSSSSSQPTHYYGTRLSTVLLVRRDGTVLFTERDIWRLDSSEEEEGCRPVPGDRKGDRVCRFQLAI